VPGASPEHNVILEELAETVATQDDWLGLELSGWRTENDARLVARRLEKTGRRVRILAGLPCPFISMPDGFDAYYRSRGSRARYNVRSRERRLGQYGTVRYEHLSADDAPRGLEDAMALHARRWHGQHTSTVFSSSAAGRAFYRASIPLAVQEGFADLAVLKLNDQVIASTIGFHHGPEYGYYMPAWHPAYQAYAPSTLLLVHLMEHASGRGAKMFDFMLGDEPYKAAWATSRARVHTIIAAAPGAVGQLWLVRTLARRAILERARGSARLRAIRRHGLAGVTRTIDQDR
jgi:CelD/BcsL family acetyltransferase involved in cellulose biosynthesis